MRLKGFEGEKVGKAAACDGPQPVQPSYPLTFLPSQSAGDAPFDRMTDKDRRNAGMAIKKVCVLGAGLMGSGI
ncbi:MAG TPA: hypothetical protein PKJ17_06150, partial [Syntrophorhabdaceae bacterium]|nr:hypothetical protein [Syntrophorhabdaceae bacterium]